MKEEDIKYILESHYWEIKEDLKWLSDKLFQAWPETQIYTGEWLTFGLYNKSILVRSNADLCKNTIKVLNYIPNVINAGFSVLNPMTHIKPHKGYTNRVTRYHLGLDIPTTNVTQCGLCISNRDSNKIGLTYINWNEGKAFCFDDTKSHSAHNYTNEKRTILILDVLK